MKTLNIIIIILAIAIICGIVSMIRLTQDLNEAEFKLSEQPKYKQLYIITKNELEECTELKNEYKAVRDTILKKDSIYTYLNY